MPPNPELPSPEAPNPESPNSESPNPEWLAWVQQLHSIAQAGLAYSRDPYDLERFTQIRQLSYEIAARCDHLTEPEAESVFGGEVGYQTPKVDVRAVVFDGDRILMVHELEDDRWSLPGGWADVGLTPAEVAVKEVAEESGLEVEPVRLLGILDKRRHPHPPYAHDTYKIFIHCRVVGGTLGGGLETSDVGYFARDELPPLSEKRNTASQLALMFRYLDDPATPPALD